MKIIITLVLLVAMYLFAIKLLSQNDQGYILGAYLMGLFFLFGVVFGVSIFNIGGEE